MPIHEFGPLKKIEDAEKEVEEGKAKEIRSAPVKVQNHASDVVRPQMEKKVDNVREKHEQKAVQKVKKVDKKDSKTTRSEKVETSHPLVHGILEIEEEEL